MAKKKQKTHKMLYGDGMFCPHCYSFSKKSWTFIQIALIPVENVETFQFFCVAKAK